ncbi:hypothetical protein [Curtobacterium sp. MCJR17_043]|uniref:hypothetical protein n=1 Tax=Curtobacterium sp. MCJR17_043 TaxID=2175660 RepID=UPI0024DFA585|nr:hypothetical protein [Curtobacterium sp. MCJR17_043]WIB34977.1 hypothetical protein DEJ15_10730 [Curtobacterium sp. MCJR17_043]
MTDAQNDQSTDPAVPADATGSTPADVDEETLEPLSHDTQSGAADYVATSPGGSGTERHVPLPRGGTGPRHRVRPGRPGTAAGGPGRLTRGSFGPAPAVTARAGAGPRAPRASTRRS